MSKHNWKQIQEYADSLSDGISTRSDLARALKLSRSTVNAALNRGALIFEFEQIDAPDAVVFTEDGNEALLKFNSAQPLNAHEAAQVAGVDLDIWEIYRQRVNMWQAGRKHKMVKLDYTNGTADGSIHDTGGWNKTYLYQIEVKFTRKERIPVSLVMEPIIVVSHKISLVDVPLPEERNRNSILFICDPHLGYNNKKPFHNRQFISSLLSIQQSVKPRYTVWNGDVLDLADFGTFPNDPAITQKTQVAAVEFGWLLSQFNSAWGKQILIEGNHEVRLRKAMMKNLSAGYDLRPVHDLDGESMLSVPRLLGLKELGVEWIGDYPNGYFQYGNARFKHGSVAKAASGATVNAVLGKTVMSTFFGHIHRYELASRRVDGLPGLVWSGSPGCATSMTLTPGVTVNSNWSTGAFLISFEARNVVAVEHIFHADEKTYFRGNVINVENYFDTPAFGSAVRDRYDL